MNFLPPTIKLPVFPQMGLLQHSMRTWKCLCCGVCFAVRDRVDFNSGRKYLGSLWRKRTQVSAAERSTQDTLIGGLLSFFFFFTLLHPEFSSRQGLRLKGNNGVLNQRTFPPRLLLGQLMAHAALWQVRAIKYMFMKRRINHSEYLWKKSYLLFFILFLQHCLAGLSCGCNYHISLACGVSPLEHQSGWLFACAATTAREVHNYLFFSQNKFARACFWVHSLPQAAVDIKENPFRMWSALCAE